FLESKTPRKRENKVLSTKHKPCVPPVPSTPFDRPLAISARRFCAQLLPFLHTTATSIPKSPTLHVKRVSPMELSTSTSKAKKKSSIQFLIEASTKQSLKQRRSSKRSTIPKKSCAKLLCFISNDLATIEISQLFFRSSFAGRQSLWKSFPPRVLPSTWH